MTNEASRVTTAMSETGADAGTPVVGTPVPDVTVPDAAAVSSDPTSSMTARRVIPHFKLALLSLGTSVFTLVLKFYAWRVTGSVGLLSDAVESTANVAAALTALFALWFAAQPADRTHPYGHEKIEFFAGGIEGGFIVAAAISIVVKAIQQFGSPHLPEELALGLGAALLATLLNALVGLRLLSEGKRHQSIVLEADGRHLLADVWTTLGVVAGLFLAGLTKLPWLDPLVALCVAINIVRIGYELLRRAFDGLMDHALPDEEVQAIRAAIDGALWPGMTYHALRTRRAGAQRFADFHLLVAGECSVSEAHDREMRIANAIRALMPEIEITTHIEPIEEPRAYGDSRLREE